MQELLVPYESTVWALGMTGALFFFQLLVADFAGIKAGHRPGTPVAVDHAAFHFRATRVHANTNESIAVFILLALFGVLSGASPGWLNALSWVYVVARLAHMVCYYAGLQIPRSVAFGVSLLALFGMLVVGVLAWA